MHKIKKAIVCFLCVALFLSIVPFGSFSQFDSIFTINAKAAQEGNYTYSVVDNKAIITDVGDSIEGEVIIPETLGGYTVTEIGYEAFKDCRRITSVVIPYGVTKISSYAFNYCSMNEIVIPDSVVEIGDYAFYNCDVLYKATLPGSLTNIGTHIFSYCSMIDNVVISEGITSLSASMFSSCGRLTNISLPSTLTSIGEKAFYYCISLGSISIPDNVEVIDDYAFGECKVLHNIDLPAQLKYLYNNAFTNCKELTNLTGFSLLNKLEHIGSRVFTGCDSLSTITIPEKVKFIGEAAFTVCDNLSSIHVHEDNESFSSKDGVLYDKYIEKLIRFPSNKNMIEYTIENTVKTIDSYAFYRCFFITEINIPEGVTQIGEYAFSLSDNLENIVLPSTITRILDSTFKGCHGLKTVVIKNGVTEINKEAFNHCLALETIELPSSLEVLGYGAFSECHALKSIEIPNGVTIIPTNAFIDCYELSDVELSDNTTVIGERAFYNCQSLEEIALPFGLLSIADEAFSWCLSLKTVDLPKSLQRIAYQAFKGCEALEQLVIYENVNEIGFDAFASTHENFVVLVVPNSYAHFHAEGYDIPYRFVNGLHIIEQPEKIQYLLGDALELEGIHLLLILDSEQLEIPINQCSVSHFNSDVLGEQEIYISYEDNVAVLVVEVLDPHAYPESAHLYENNTDYTWVYIHPSQAAYLTITFSAETQVEEKFDEIYIYEGIYDNLSEALYTFTGDELSGKTITVSGNSFSIRLKSDEIGRAYGFSIVSIQGTEEPTTEEPTTEEPTTEEPTTEEPTTEEPTTEEPTTEEPTTEEPTTEKITWTAPSISIDENSGFATGLKADTKKALSAKDFVDSIEITGNGRVIIFDAKGNEIKEFTTSVIGTGTVIQIKDGNKVVDERIIVVKGDTDGDGKISAADARLALRNSANLETLSDAQIAAAAKMGAEKLSAADARKLLRVSAGLETI